MFEIIAPQLGPASPVAGGGRYDSLLRQCGAPRAVPAVGAAIHTERLLAAVARGQAMSEPKLVFAVPSKGRLMEQAAEMLADNGIKLKKVGHERGYRGEIEGMRHVEVTFVSASEVAALLRTGKAHLGITGEDLVREQITDADMRVEFLKRFDFGHADVVVAVPAWWVDVRSMADLDEMASAFRRAHGRWYRVATKYLNLTRRFFAASGVTGLPHRREPRRHRGHARGRHGGPHRRHHDDRRDAARERPQGARRRHRAALAGRPRRLRRGVMVAAREEAQNEIMTRLGV